MIGLGKKQNKYFLSLFCRDIDFYQYLGISRILILCKLTFRASDKNRKIAINFHRHSVVLKMEKFERKIEINNLFACQKAEWNNFAECLNRV